MQSALRKWVQEWLFSTQEILKRPETAKPILVYIFTNPFPGRRTNTFTYDLQQDGMLERALSSAAFRLGTELKRLNTQDLSWCIREHYFSYRSDELVENVRRKNRVLVRMLNAETAIVDCMLKFSVVDVPNLGLETALKRVRRSLGLQLKRFCAEFDLSNRADELLGVATGRLKALISKEEAEDTES